MSSFWKLMEMEAHWFFTGETKIAPLGTTSQAFEKYCFSVPVWEKHGS